MTFRVRIISPLKAAEADLARRQRRYSQHAGPDTQVTVVNLAAGPPALNSAGDVLVSAAAIYAAGVATQPETCDALLIDCVFDPSVEELYEATGIPTFGPTRTTLPLISLIAENFSIVARTPRQCELLAETVERNGFGNYLNSLRALEISYEEARQESIFIPAMLAELRKAIHEDQAQAVMFGSTTMALTPAMVATAAGRPLFMPGLTALRVMEHLWNDGLWPDGSAI